FPQGTRQVLNAVNENVVSLGVRAQDTTPGMSEWIRRRSFAGFLPYRQQTTRVLAKPIDGSLPTFRGRTEFLLPDQVPIDRTLSPTPPLLGALLLSGLSRSRLTGGNGSILPLDNGSVAASRPPTSERTYRAILKLNQTSVSLIPDGDIPVELVA